jgi:hypothetical protein
MERAHSCADWSRDTSQRKEILDLVLVEHAYQRGIRCVTRFENRHCHGRTRLGEVVIKLGTELMETRTHTFLSGANLVRDLEQSQSTSMQCVLTCAGDAARLLPMCWMW